jgi:hypothetical protein
MPSPQSTTTLPSSHRGEDGTAKPSTASDHLAPPSQTTLETQGGHRATELVSKMSYLPVLINLLLAPVVGGSNAGLRPTQWTPSRSYAQNFTIYLETHFISNLAF